MPQPMESADERIYSDRLMKRRDRIWARVIQLHADARQLTANRLLIDEATYRRRDDLLGYLSRFHLGEIDRIDEALKRMASGQYGVCFGCRKPSQAEWLESFPAAEFCATCHAIKERIGAGQFMCEM